MAFTSILRKSVNALAPLAIRLTRVQRNYHSCIFTALNHSFQSQRPATNWFHSNSHYFSTADESRRTSSVESLIGILESEVQCAEESDEHDQVEETSSEFPFKIQDFFLFKTVTLTRKYGGELIEVRVHMPDLKGEDVVNNDVVYEKPRGFPEIPYPFPKKCNSRRFFLLPLVVTVSKEGGLCLEFNVTAFPDKIAIDSLSVRNPDSAYEGPDFRDLDENLQKAFHNYLEIRGIKPIITNFMHEYMINKDYLYGEVFNNTESKTEEQRLKSKKEFEEELKGLKEERRLVKTTKKSLKNFFHQSKKNRWLKLKNH